MAIGAPVLNALADRLPGLRLTVRSGVPAAKLRERIRPPFQHIDETSDFGFVMQDALAIDVDASADAYRVAHACWDQRVDREARLLEDMAPDLVLTNISYLPLAGAARAGISAVALCSLNWGSLFSHFFGQRDWAPPILDQILDAYRSAKAFLRTTPGMPMTELDNVMDIGPVAALGHRHDLGFGAGEKTVLVAMGGIDHRLPVDNWPAIPNIRWLVPQSWQVRHRNAVAFEALGLSFSDLLASVDAILTKPGYGTFVEAACQGTPVLYQRRQDWPEQEALIQWLDGCSRSLEIPPASAESGELAPALDVLWALPPNPPVQPTGVADAADFLVPLLTGAGSRSA